jgi:predicted ATPase
MPGLESITLRGFKTISEIDDFKPGAITVLIGPNGAGKSNFISFFRLLSWALAPPGQLQAHVATLGGASTILHDGPRRTNTIEAHLKLTTAQGRNEYSFRLAYAAGDTIIYTEEKYRFSSFDLPGAAPWRNLDAGHREAKLINAAEGGM